MTESHSDNDNAWWAKGLLFENCSCQAVCPGHIHFDQLCTHERCKGYWAFQFDEGTIDGLSLAGRRAVIAYDSPRHMIDGGWVQILILDQQTTPEQGASMEALFSGARGGPWEILGRFVGERLETRYLPIVFEDEPMRKRVEIPGLLESTVETLRGRDRAEPVRFENIFNQIHASSQVIAMGDARYDDGTIRFDNTRSHGLWSRFEWRVQPA